MFSWLRRASGSADSTPYGDPERVALVKAVLDELAPALALDGGRIELLGVEEQGVVVVSLEGACASCAASASTLEGVLAPALSARASWFRSVRSR